MVMNSGQRAAATGRAAVLIVVLALLALTLAVPVRNWIAQRSAIAVLEGERAEREEQVSALRIQKERWEDPAFVAAEARRRLHFVLPGETGYVTIGGEIFDEEPQVVELIEPNLPWEQQIWLALETIDRGPEPEE
jgi:cell division protein FtsB